MALRGELVVTTRRGYSYEQLEYLQAPTAGWNPDAPPHLCPDNQAPILDNLLAKPGKVTPRGPMRMGVDLTSHYSAHNVNINGAQPATAGFLIASRTSGLATPWQIGPAPAHASLTLYNVDIINHTATAVVAPNRDSTPGYRWIDFDGQLYGIAGDSASLLNGPSAVYTVPAVSLMSTSTPDGSGPPTALSAAPHGAFDLNGYQQRIWLLAGCDTPGGSAVHYNTNIYFTIPTQAGGGNATADWQDPISGLTNIIRLDQDVSDQGMGLAKCRNGLLVLRARSIWIIRGNTTDNYTAQIVSRQVGCLDPRSIAETDQGVYFLSEQGLQLTDGVSVRNVSGPVTETLRTAIAEAVPTGIVPAYQVQMTSRGQLMVSVITYDAVSGGGSTDCFTHSLFSGLYDPTYGTWSRITSDLFTADHTQSPADAEGNKYPCILLGWRATNALVSVGDKQVITMETAADTFLANSSGDGSGPNTSGRGMYDNSGTSTASPTLHAIPARWRTKAVPLANGGRKSAAMKRWYADYLMESVGRQLPGWQVTATSVLLGAIGSAVTLPATLAGSTAVGPYGGPNAYGAHVLLMRFDQDFVEELTDLAFDVKFVDAAPPATYPTSVIADLYGMGVEFQFAGDRFNGGQ